MAYDYVEVLSLIDQVGEVEKAFSIRPIGMAGIGPPRILLLVA